MKLVGKEEVNVGRKEIRPGRRTSQVSQVPRSPRVLRAPAEREYMGISAGLGGWSDLASARSFCLRSGQNWDRLEEAAVRVKQEGCACFDLLQKQVVIKNTAVFFCN